jgi:hypothetical protein
MDKHYVVVGGNSGIAQSALSHLSQESITLISAPKLVKNNS